MNHLVYSYLFFVHREIGHAKYIDPDIPLERQFDDIFDEFLLIAASIRFEMNHAIEIPDEYMDFKQTPRQIAERISRLPKIEDKDFGEFLFNKDMILNAGFKIYNDQLTAEGLPN